MSNGDDVLDNWEEIDEAGLCMTLQTKLQADATATPTTVRIASTQVAATKMKVLQRPQSLQEASTAAPKQLTIAKKPQTGGHTEQSSPVMMVLHKSASEYDAANYANPISNQTVKILRRPAQAEERRDPNGLRPKQPIKTLQQREQEYAEARLRILGAAKNPEDDKPESPATATNNSTTPAAAAQTAPAASNNNNGSGATSGPPGMHRSNSAPKMTPSPQCYSNYNNYFQAPVPPPALNYFYQQPPTQQPHYNQLMPPYGTAVPPPLPPATQPGNAQQTWSPVVGGSVSAALLRQQQQQQHSQQQSHGYNDSVLRLPRGPCPNGSIGFQMRR